MLKGLQKVLRIIVQNWIVFVHLVYVESLANFLIFHYSSIS